MEVVPKKGKKKGQSTESGDEFAEAMEAMEIREGESSLWILTRSERKVQFKESKVHMFDHEDAPAFNIYDVQSSQSQSHLYVVDDGKGELVPTDVERNDTFHIMGLNYRVKESLDTKTMPLEILNEALSSRGLSLRGTREAKIARLEAALVSEGYAPSPKKKEVFVKEKQGFKEDEWLSKLGYDQEVLSAPSFGTFSSFGAKPVKSYSRRGN